MVFNSVGLFLGLVLAYRFIGAFRIGKDQRSLDLRNELPPAETFSLRSITYGMHPDVLCDCSDKRII